MRLFPYFVRQTIKLTAKPSFWSSPVRGNTPFNFTRRDSARLASLGPFRIMPFGFLRVAQAPLIALGPLVPVYFAEFAHNSKTDDHYTSSLVPGCRGGGGIGRGVVLLFFEGEDRYLKCGSYGNFMQKLFGEGMKVLFLF